MAFINVEILSQNLEAVNGQFTFTSNFYNSVTNALLNDVKFPQNQVYTISQITNPLFIPLQIADGVYPINNVKVKIVYKDIVQEYVIPNQQINCIAACTIFPIISVTKLTPTSYNVALSATSTQTINWRLLNTSNAVVVAGTSNINAANNFNITTPALATGSYLFEATATTCKGKDIFGFSVTNALPACQFGPSLSSIINSSPTQLQFQFDALEVFGLTWRIKQGTNVLRSGVLKHTSIAQPNEPSFSNSTPTVTYGALSVGTYTFEIEGSTCTSTPVSLTFTLVADTPLAFITGSPSVTGSAGNYTLSLNINKSGAYNTVILNTTTGTYYQNGNITYTANTPYLKTALPVGQYFIKVGTLETNVNIQNSGGTPCSSGPTLSNVLSSSTTGLQFLFDANNVTAITWRIKQAGNVVRNGVVFPVNNNPFITFTELPQGVYSLEIEGNNCSSAVSSGSFEIVNIPQGNNAGVIVTNVSGKYIGIINSKDLKAVANPTTGAIRLFYDEIAQAEGSNKQVKGWLLNGQLCEIKASEIAAFKSSNGLQLPDGNYHFYLYYAATDIATTYEQLKPNMYQLFLNPAEWPKNSRTLQELIIEVKTNSVI